MVGWQEVAAPGTHNKFPLAGSADADANPPISALSAIRRNVTEHVLMADVRGNLPASVRDFFCEVGEIGFAARFPGELLENLRVLIRVVFVEQPDRIDNHVGALCNAKHLCEIVSTGVIAPVAYQEYHLLAAGIGLEMFQRDLERIVKGRSSAWESGQQGGSQVVCVTREGHICGQAERNRVAEVDHKLPILRIARLRECQRSLNYLAHLRRHASAVVYHEPDRHRHVEISKDFDFLRSPIFANAEIRHVQTRNKMSFVVCDGDGQKDQLRVYPENVVVGRVLRGSEKVGKQAGSQKAHRQRQKRMECTAIRERFFRAQAVIHLSQPWAAAERNPRGGPLPFQLTQTLLNGALRNQPEQAARQDQ
jgi:hypothetical protein